MNGLLEGKKILVMGVANKRSIAWGCAQVMAQQGATLIFTYQNERMKKSLAKLVNDDDRLIECDVAADENIEKAFTEVQKQFGKIDGIVHAIAYADRNELQGDVMKTTREGYNLAQDISAYSLIAGCPLWSKNPESSGQHRNLDLYGFGAGNSKLQCNGNCEGSP